MKMVLDISKLPSQEKRQFIFLTPQDLRLVSNGVCHPRFHNRLELYAEE